MSTPPPQQKDKSNGSLIAGPLHRNFYSGLPCALLSSHPELTRQRTTGQEQWQSDRWATAPENYSCLPCALLISHPKLTRGLRNLAGSVATTATSKTPEPYIDGARSRTSTNQGTCEREMTEAPSKRDICGAFSNTQERPADHTFFQLLKTTCVGNVPPSSHAAYHTVAAFCSPERHFLQH